MKSDFTELNSEDDIVMYNDLPEKGGYLQRNSNTKVGHGKEELPARITEPAKKTGSQRETNNQSATNSKNMNHRERSRNRYGAGTGSSKIVKIQSFQATQSQDRIFPTQEYSPSKLNSRKPTQTYQNQNEIIQQPNLSTIQIKEVVKTVKNKSDVNEEKTENKRSTIENSNKRQTLDSNGDSTIHKAKNSVRKLESIKRGEQNDSKLITKHNNIINQQRLPKVPGQKYQNIEKHEKKTQPGLQKVEKRFSNLQKIYGVDKNNQRRDNRTDSSIVSPLKPPRPTSSRPIDNRQIRRDHLDRAKELLSGKVSTVWIYAISSAIKPDLKDRIFQVYKGLLDEDNLVPFVKQAWEIQPFLQLPNTYFKIVTNLENADRALGFKINIKVVEYYIYNDQGQNGLSRALQYKNWSKKVKGIYSDLERIIEKTQEQIDDTIQIYRLNNELEANVNQGKFPSFLKLSGKDKTQATLYRGNLYGSIKIDHKDKQVAYSNFMTLVRQKYNNIEKEQKNMMEYSQLKHLQLIKTKQQAQKVIKFYVRESFYYQILNSMLRTLKSTEEFKPCILPFNETYHSVKIFYNQFVKQNNRKIPRMELYRGARLKKRDFNCLEPGVFIEMYGFMSTSKSIETAKKFTDRDGYVFVIHVEERQLPAKWDKYDHGFVDINKNHLAAQAFAKEEEVLFNALNIYKVQKVEKKNGYVFIHLEYGAIFDLLAKPKDTLLPDQKDTLINYQYCTKLMGDIEDQGDVHLLSSQFDQAKDYYNQKIAKNQGQAKNYHKLANVQKECGEIDQAQKNGQKALQIMTDQLDTNDRETCLKVFSIHSKNAQINIMKQDYLNADDQLTQGIQMLDDNDVFHKAKKIRERGQIKFKKGEVKQAERDFDASQKMFNDIQKKSQNQKWQVQKKYIFSVLTLWCSDFTKDELQQNKNKELTEIQQMQKEINDMKGDIEDELVKVNKSLKDVALYVEDKDKYEYCVKKGRALLLNVQQRQTNDPVVKAKLKVMEATIQDYLELAQSQKLLNDAIELIQKDTPFDPTVGQYATILAKLQKKQIEKFTNPESGMKLDPDKKLQYNQAEHKAIYNRCKGNFQKAINILIYNNKTKDSPEVIGLKNQIGQLDFSSNNFKNCEEIIREVKDSSTNVLHSEISKTSLLLSKIAFARGQLKLSFQNLNESDGTLKKCIIKDPSNPKYQSVYQKNDVYLEILLIRSKVYHKQLHHDLSLTELNILQGKVLIKMQGYESHNLLASVYEQIAQVYAGTGQKKFLQYFQKAIQIRQKQMGEYNIFNAVSYCNYAKYLMLMNDLKLAAQNLTKAVQIFSCLSNDHPINWVIHFSNGIFCEQKNNFDEASKLFRNCLDMAVNKFDSSHITIKKVRLRIAKALLKLDKIDQSFTQLQKLEEETEFDLNQSRTKVEVVEETDDEKITLEKIILTQLKHVIQQEQNNVRFSQIEVQKYKQKFDNLRNTFRLEGPNKQ